MKICYDQGCNDIGVVIPTKLHHYLFYLQPYFSKLGTAVPKSFTGTFPTIAALMFKRISICKSVNKIFWGEVFIVRNTVKTKRS